MRVPVRFCGMLFAVVTAACSTAEQDASPTTDATVSRAEDTAVLPDDVTVTDEAPMRRLLVLARQGQAQEDVAEVAIRELGSSATTQPLFPGVDDDELARTYIVIAPINDPTVSAWDAAYRFESAGNFETVEPDRENTLVPQFRRNAATAACAFGGSSANPDNAWSLRKINAAEAWALDPPGAGKKFGEGISICHPDTGWTLHDDLDTLDLSRARNVMDNNNDARDPHVSGPFLNPGHGTGTGSVIGSDGGIAADTGTIGPGKITGVAPAATIVPIRTVNSVIQVFDSDVAKAVAYAVEAQCDVVSMSLGGRGFFGLKRAVKFANDNGLILVAAAGNCVGTIVAPAAYDGTIAVAATNDQDEPWKGSSRGKKITLSAPGENVWSANGETAVNLPSDIKFSNGTSFATAEIAGAAALWLAYHTRARVELAAGSGRVSDLFLKVIQRTARTPDNWDSSKYGPGIIDLEAMLRDNLTSSGPSMASGLSTPGTEAIKVLAAVIDRNPAEVAQAVAVMLGNPSDVDAQTAQWVPELIDVAMQDPDAFNIALDRALAPPAPIGGPPRVQARLTLAPLMSERLRSAMQ